MARLDGSENATDGKTNSLTACYKHVDAIMLLKSATVLCEVIIFLAIYLCQCTLLLQVKILSRAINNKTFLLNTTKLQSEQQLFFGLGCHHTCSNH